ETGTAVAGGGPDEIKVVRTGLLSAEETVDFATSDGTAMAGSDYSAVSGTLTFATGEAEKIIEIPILSGTNAHDLGTFDVVLSNPSGGAILDAGGDQVEVTIHGNSTPGHFRVGSNAFSETAGTATIRVLRDGGSQGAVTVDYTTSDGTATAGADYT